MPTIVDGYNLLHVTGILGRGIRPGTLERARNGLLNFLASALDPAELVQTSVVFDAKAAPPGLPRQLNYRGISVYYAAQYDDADSLIEELIQSHSAPRRLTVVSSDHRVQRAARRRRAVAVDSDTWYAGLVRNRQVQRQDAPVVAKPEAPLSAAQVEYWLNEFANVPSPEVHDPESRDPTCETGNSDQPGTDQGRRDRGDRDSVEGTTDRASYPEAPDELNPFPPGYAEDLLDDDEAQSS